MRSEIAKYLAKTLFLVGKSRYTINSSKFFVNYIKKQKSIILLLNKSFIWLPLDEIIDIILQIIYIVKEIGYIIPKREMGDLLY